MSEEERAWDIGRVLLAEAGLTNWTAFERYAREKLQGYEEGLRPRPRPRGQRG